MRHSKFTNYELAAAGLLALGVLYSFGSTAEGEGQNKDTICHHGKEITVADPAILAAHLAHGDCVGLCEDCLGRCCYQVDGKSISNLLTELDCATISGRFSWNKAAPCFGGGD